MKSLSSLLALCGRNLPVDIPIEMSLIHSFDILFLSTRTTVEQIIALLVVLHDYMKTLSSLLALCGRNLPVDIPIEMSLIHSFDILFLSTRTTVEQIIALLVVPDATTLMRRHYNGYQDSNMMHTFTVCSTLLSLSLHENSYTQNQTSKCNLGLIPSPFAHKFCSESLLWVYRLNTCSFLHPVSLSIFYVGIRLNEMNYQFVTSCFVDKGYQLRKY